MDIKLGCFWNFCRSPSRSRSPSPSVSRSSVQITFETWIHVFVVELFIYLYGPVECGFPCNLNICVVLLFHFVG